MENDTRTLERVLLEKKEKYKKIINKTAGMSYNNEQRALACDIIDNANEHNIDSLLTFVTQRIKIGFRFDLAPEVNHNCVSLVKKNNIMSFGHGGQHHKFIIGENYNALKNLLVTYKNQVDVIYIDPPYNTESCKNDYKVEIESSKFIYRDKYSRTGWLNMMQERLKLAKELLSDRGIIFISIDDNEQAYLKVLCDEIFGEKNFVANAPRKTTHYARTYSSTQLQILHDYVLIYCKNKNKESFNLKNNGIKQYPYEDDRGKFYITNFQNNGQNGTRTARPNLYYPIYQDAHGNLSLEKTNNNDKEILPKRHQNDDGRWMWSRKKFLIDYKNLMVHNEKLCIKHYYDPQEDQHKYQIEKTWLESFDEEDDYSTWLDKDLNAKGTKELKRFELQNLFHYPKPVSLIKHLLKISSKPNSIILDFFAGSGTTGQAVMELNEEDGGSRKCILVTNDQNNIATNITYERLYRICNGKGTNGETFKWKYDEENPDKYYLYNNTWHIFDIEEYDLKIDNYKKVEELLQQAKVELKKLNENWQATEFDIYHQLSSLNPYRLESNNV